MLRALALLLVPCIALAIGLGGKAAPKRELITLTEDNTVSLSVPVSEESVADVQVALMEKSAKLSKNAKLYLVLNSPGGDIEAGMKLIAFIKGLPQRVDTISMFSASMSFIISQNLGERLVMENSTLMSHRAKLGGVSGEVPGSYVTRSNFIIKELEAISNQVAQRAGMSLPDYQALIANELWMNAPDAIARKFADRTVDVRCDASLSSYGAPVTLEVFIFKISLQFHKCPLITQPKFLGGSMDIAKLLATNKGEFYRRYIEPGVYSN